MKKYSAARVPVVVPAFLVAVTVSLVSCSAPENEKKTAELKGENQTSEIAKAEASKESAADATPAAGAQDDFVVQVNGEKLTTAEVDAMLDNQMAAISKQVPPDQLEQMKSEWRQQLANYFIQKTVLVQEADRQKIAVADDDVNAQLKEYEQHVPPGAKLEDVLKQQGVTLEKLRSDIGSVLKARKLIDSQVPAEAAPAEEDITNYFEMNEAEFNEPEMVRARHILVKTGAADNETVKTAKNAKINDIRNKLLAGGDFAKLAQEHSDCPSKDSGGDLGAFARGQMVKPFEDAAFGQKVNEIGPVVETQFGYHIIQTQEHIPAKTKTLEEVRPDIIKSLQEQNRQKALKDYIDGLIKKATIVYGKN